MSNEIQKDVLTKTRVVYQKAGMDSITIQRDVEYKVTDAVTLTMDVYYPDVKSGSCFPVVLIVGGYPDLGHQKLLGCKFKETGSSVSWAQLIAASGIVSITYTNTEPATDLNTLLQHIRQNSGNLRIDGNKIGLWASSGNVPLALSALINHEYLKCAALLYGYTMGPKIAEMAKMYGFVNACADKSIDDVPKNLPMFIARAGQDQIPCLNETLDRFISNALACNLPITFVNHPNGPHAFDLFDDSHTTRMIIQQVLNFFRLQLQ